MLRVLADGPVSSEPILHATHEGERTRLRHDETRPSETYSTAAAAAAARRRRRLARHAWRRGQGGPRRARRLRRRAAGAAAAAARRRRRPDHRALLTGQADVAVRASAAAASRRRRCRSRCAGLAAAATAGRTHAGSPWFCLRSPTLKQGGASGNTRSRPGSVPPRCAQPSGQGPCTCLLYTSPSPRDKRQSRMPSSA